MSSIAALNVYFQEEAVVSRAMAAGTKTIKEHWKGVLRWFHSRITNGLMEGIRPTTALPAVHDSLRRSEPS